MAEIPGIILDMDGVLVHSNPAHKKAIQTFCKNHNQHLSEKFLKNRLYGRPNKEWIPELFGEISSEELKTLADEKEQMFRENFIPKDNAITGVHNFLQSLKERNFPLAVATSAPFKNAEYILGNLNIDQYFDIVLDSSHVEKGKPDPQVYLKTVKELNKNPENCIVFEDSISGVESGRRAGATVIGVTTTHTSEELSPCALTIGNFQNLSPDELLNLCK